LKRGLTFIAIMLLALGASSETLWTLHSDASYLRDISISESAVWGVGRGGALGMDRSGGDFSFLRVSEGLPTHELTSVLALSDEEIWFGSDGEGLLRYRPEEENPWKQFRLLPQSLAGDEVLCLAQDGEGRIWYGCREKDDHGLISGGFGLIDGEAPGAVWAEPEGLGSITVSALAFVDEDLFVGTAAGIYHLNAAWELSFEEEGPLGEIDQLVSAGGNLFALSEGMIFSFDPPGASWESLSDPWGNPKALAAFGESLYVSLHNSSSGTRVYRYDVQDELWTDLSDGIPDFTWSYDYFVEPVMAALAVNTDDEIWLGGEIYQGTGPGLYHRDAGVWTRHALDQGPMGPATKALAFGPTGRLWTASNAGAAMQENGQWSRFHQLKDVDYWPAWSLDLLEDSAGWVWFCRYNSTGDEAFSRMNVSTGEIVSIPIGAGGAPSTGIISMVEDDAGNRWFATDNAGIAVCEADDQWQLYNSDTENGGLPSPNINALADLGSGRMAMLCSGVGLCIWDRASETFWIPGNGITDPGGDLVMDTSGASLAPASDGGVWVGQLDGLIKVARSGSSYIVLGKLGKADGINPGLLSSQIRDLAAGADASVWVATELGLSQASLDLDAGTWIVENYTNRAGRDEANGGLNIFGPEVLAPLPGMTVYRVALSPDGERILLGMQSEGLVELEILPDPPSDPEEISLIRLYPNPVRLSLGQQEVRFMGVDFPVDVRIYNVEGQMVRELLEVQPGEEIWPDLATRFGSRAVSGIYLIQLSYEGRQEVRTLAVVR
jgi:streptogramin lyase